MILADENVNFKIISALRGLQIEVRAIAEFDPSIPDDEVLEQSQKGNFILYKFVYTVNRVKCLKAIFSDNRNIHIN